MAEMVNLSTQNQFKFKDILENKVQLKKWVCFG